jgi:hypothetical protein
MSASPVRSPSNTSHATHFRRRQLLGAARRFVKGALQHRKVPAMNWAAQRYVRPSR